MAMVRAQLEGEPLDLFAIFAAVARRGGYEAVTISRHTFPAVLLLPRFWPPALRLSCPGPSLMAGSSGKETAVPSLPEEA